MIRYLLCRMQQEHQRCLEEPRTYCVFPWFEIKKNYSSIQYHARWKISSTTFIEKVMIFKNPVPLRYPKFYFAAMRVNPIFQNCNGFFFYVISTSWLHIGFFLWAFGASAAKIEFKNIAGTKRERRNMYKK